MNLLESTDEASSDALFASFNQDCTSLVVGSKKEFKLYHFMKVNEFATIRRNVADDICIIERYFSSRMVALVTISAPRMVKVYDMKKETEKRNYTYPNTILAVKLNRARLVTCLEENLYIHRIGDLTLLHVIRDTPPNLLGLCILSSSQENNFLAYPGSNSNGEVHVFDVFNLLSKNAIKAHENPLAAMAFDATGTKIATASVKGTVIRVFNVMDKTKLHEFRRGYSRCVRIYSLCFSQDSSFLSASSDTETVHIFRVDLRRERAAEEAQSWSNYLCNVVSSSASVVPHLGEMMNQSRSFATVRLPFSGLRNICALVMIQKSLRVLIASGNGILYIYNVDTVEGGDCKFVLTFNLLATNEGGSSESGVKVLESSPPDFSVPTD